MNMTPTIRPHAPDTHASVTQSRSTGDRGNRDERPERSYPHAAVLPSSQIVHDLGNFLTGMQMLAANLLAALPEGSTLWQQVASLDRAALHSVELCHQLRWSLSGHDGRTDDRVRHVDLSTLVEDMRVLLEVMVPSGARLDLQLSRDLPPVVVEPTQIRQVVLDLLTNAAEALEGSGGMIVIRTGSFECCVGDVRPACDVADRAEHPDGELRSSTQVFLEVSDTGCGIPEPELQHVFDPRFTTKPGGQGLGLASVRQIVAAYGGEVMFRSAVGRGTVACCLFPAAATEGAPHARRTPSVDGDIEKHWPVGPPAFSRPVTILLVEDNEAVRRSSKLFLETQGTLPFEVLEAGTGQQALAVCEHRWHDLSLVVLDMNLPNAAGGLVLEQLRRLAPELPVIVVSGLSKQQLVAQCGDLQPEGWLVKPFDGDALLDKIGTVLGLQACGAAAAGP